MLDLFLLLTFLACAGVLSHVFVVHPLLVQLLARILGREHERADPARAPRISILFAAHDEEAVLEKKLANCLELDWPREALQVVAISDASEDGTDRILELHARRDERISPLRLPVRSGKNAALNAGLLEANGDLLVFTDANAMLARDALHHVSRAFADPEVGCVCGELVLELGNGEGAARSEGLYWRLESATKRAESALGSCLVGNGSLLAVRRALARPLDPDVANDFQQPMFVAASGRRVVYEPRARAHEVTSTSYREEFERRVRIITRGLTGMVRHHRHMSAWRRFLFWSHKGLRWFTAFFLVGTFVTSLALSGSHAFFGVLAILQIAFHACAGFAVARLLRGRAAGRIASLALYVDTLALAGAFAIARFLRGRRSSHWIKPLSTRRTFVPLPERGSNPESPRAPRVTPVERSRPARTSGVGSAEL